jgi:hypothetical protein
MSYWLIGILLYVAVATLTAAPIVVAVARGVKLHPGGATFEEAVSFSETARVRLQQHYSRMLGTLAFWKKQAEIYRRLHYYTLGWTIPSSVVIPFLAQAMNTDPFSKWLITIVSAHTAILLAFHKALKVDANLKAFRQGESEFYDSYRRMMDRPRSFGETEEQQLEAYFDHVENLRKYIRNAELDNLPTLEQVKTQTASERSNGGPK